MALSKCPECGHDVSSLAAACPNCGAPVVLEPERKTADLSATTATGTTRTDASAPAPVPQTDRFVSSDVSRWLFAFVVAASGFVSAVLADKVSFWHHDWGPYIFPGLSFGLVTGLWWLLYEQSLRKRRAVILLTGATVAYAAAYWVALFAFAFVSAKGGPVPLRLAEGGIIGGAVGTILLGATLALTLKKVLRGAWHAFLVIGIGTGAALALGSLGKQQEVSSLGNFGTRLFIFLWQFAVAAYLCSVIYSCKAPAWLASERALAIRRWTTRSVWAALVLSVIHLALVQVYEEKQKVVSGGGSTQSGSGNATAWADAYRNAKFITRAEFLRRVGPVQLLVRQGADVSEAVPNLESIVRTAATGHGWTISDSPTDFQLVVDANLDRSKIKTTEYGQFGAREQEGYQMVYTASVKIGFMTKANCRRGDKFVQLDVYPCYVWNAYDGAMGDLVDFATAYAKAFREALGGAFDGLAKISEADDTGDEAWKASLWPPAQNSEMYNNFVSPVKDDTGPSKRIFYGVTKFALLDINLLGEDAAKEFNADSLRQRWSTELNRNGQEIDQSSDLLIRHDVDVENLAYNLGFMKSTLCYVNMSYVRAYQRNVVFPFNGELRRETVWLWSDLNTAAALPKDNSDTAQGLVDQSIRSAAREFDLRR